MDSRSLADSIRDGRCCLREPFHPHSVHFHILDSVVRLENLLLERIVPGLISHQLVHFCKSFANYFLNHFVLEDMFLFLILQIVFGFIMSFILGLFLLILIRFDFHILQMVILRFIHFYIFNHQLFFISLSKIIIRIIVQQFWLKLMILKIELLDLIQNYYICLFSVQLMQGCIF